MVRNAGVHVESINNRSVLNPPCCLGPRRAKERTLGLSQ
jgi:hypothetical protein